MLMCAQVVHNPPALIAIDHVSVETPLLYCTIGSVEGANPGHSLPPQRVAISKVTNRKRDVAALFRKHDAAPGPEIQKRKRVDRPMPDLVHHASAYGRGSRFARKREPPLNHRMQPFEILSKSKLIDGWHRSPLPVLLFEASAGNDPRRQS